MNGALVTNVTLHIQGYNLRHLTPSTEYTIKVVARGSSGNTTESNSVSVTTLASTDTVPPPAPTNARVESDDGCRLVWLVWDQSGDNVDPQAAIEYEFIINGVLNPLEVVTGAGGAVDRTGNTSAPIIHAAA